MAFICGGGGVGGVIGGIGVVFFALIILDG